MQLRRKTKQPAPAQRTAVSFSTHDLAAMGQLLAAGQVMLQPKQRPAIVARIKAAMTRLGVPAPAGL